MPSAFLPRHLSLLALAGLLLAPPAHAAAPAPPPAPAPQSIPWDSGAQGGFITSLCRDRRNNIWVGTEGQGAWRYDPSAPQGKAYTHFTRKDGLGDDDAYALACDGAGRVWVGTLNHGVSVYNGQAWKTYGIAGGLPGVHVVALAVCPTDGDVWGATEAGLFRFSPASDSWKTYTRADGLPSDAATALAFTAGGDLLAATEADGIALGAASGGYRSWHVTRGPLHPPPAATGNGLPTSLVNCLLVSREGAIFAGTDCGLARSLDGGMTWRFLRGADWADKEAGRVPGYAALVDNADVRAIEVLPLDDPADKPVRIAAGGTGGGGWSADEYFTGGQTFTSNDSVDTRAVPDPAPQSVYRSARFGSFLYTLPGLRPGAHYRVRLHLAEVGWDGPGRRVFNVTVNGQPALTRFDIFAEAGGKDKAVVREAAATADPQGRIVLAFQGVPPLPAPRSPSEMAEDYVASLAEDGAGHLLIGHRQRGLEVMDTKTGRRLWLTGGEAPPLTYAAAVLPLISGAVLVGGYDGGGLRTLTPPGVVPVARALAPIDIPALPKPAPPPGLAALNALLRATVAVPPSAQAGLPQATALADDWTTEGDWLGRYGRYWACFPALFHPIPEDYLWGAGWEPVDYGLTMGPNHSSGDSLRYWLQTRYTTEAHCLELPPTYLHSRVLKNYTTWDNDRRDTSVDDHGETYPMSLDGPDIYTTVAVPDGLYVLSLYFFNRQTFGGGCIDRDYRLSVREHTGNGPEDVGGFDGQPELAHGRVRQYALGVYKRFLVRGPVTLTAQVNRNNSWNTELDGVMLDLVDEDPAPYFQTVDQWNAREAQRDKERQRLVASRPASNSRFRPAPSEAEAANRLFDALAEKRLTNSAWWATEGRRYYVPLLRPAPPLVCRCRAAARLRPPDPPVRAYRDLLLPNGPVRAVGGLAEGGGPDDRTGR